MHGQDDRMMMKINMAKCFFLGLVSFDENGICLFDKLFQTIIMGYHNLSIYQNDQNSRKKKKNIKLLQSKLAKKQNYFF